MSQLLVSVYSRAAHNGPRRMTETDHNKRFEKATYSFKNLACETHVMQNILTAMLVYSTKSIILLTTCFSSFAIFHISHSKLH